ncbi:hypothetical protein KPL70_001618 [Citrus sinensis]|nr:hypothetical protein KPL70_001618 [Citrus sinensis]
MDVFSFGVLLLELIWAEGKVLWAKVEGILEGNEGRKVKRVKEWIDEILLQDSISMEGVMRAMGIAIACLHKDPSKRPSMVDIVHALSKSDDSVSDISDDASSSSQANLQNASKSFKRNFQECQIFQLKSRNCHGQLGVVCYWASKLIGFWASRQKKVGHKPVLVKLTREMIFPPVKKSYKTPFLP